MYGIKDYVEPIEGKFRITSNQGNRKSKRTTNGARMSSFHHGVDIAGAEPGSKPPIRNVTAGRVVFVGKAGGWGNAVIVENNDGYRVQYGHLDSTDVNVGDVVSAGQPIGIMGDTGNVTGVHLDLIVTKDGKTIKRDGAVLADAPASIARRAGGTGKKNSPSGSGNITFFQAAKPPLTESESDDVDLFGGSPMTVLKSSTGLVVPENKAENALFSGLAAMNLKGDLEGIYAEAAKAIAGAKDSIVNRPMIQSDNPLRVELGAIFDRLEV